MTAFRDDGHLTDGALSALIKADDLPELSRLELAEHLSCCDACLERYASALEAVELLTPPKTCREGIFRRIRRRTARLLFSRFGAAAAAVAVAVTAVWTVPPPEANTRWEPDASVFGERFRNWTDSVNEGLGNILGLFEIHPQGGYHL